MKFIRSKPNPYFLLVIFFSVLSISLYVFWLMFKDATYVRFIAGGVLVFSAILAFRLTKIVSFFSIFLVAYLSLNLFPYYYTSASDQILPKDFRYLWITGACLSIFILSYTLTYRIKSSRYTEFQSLRVLYKKSTSLSGLKYGLLYLPLIFSLFLLYTEIATSSGIAQHSRSVTKEEFGIIARFGRYFIILSLPCLFIIGANAPNNLKKIKGLIEVLIIFIFLVSVFFALRTRSYLVGPLVSYFGGVFCFFLLTSNKNIVKTRLNSKYVMLIAGAVFLLVFISAYVRVYRGIMEVSDREVNYGKMIELTMTSGDLGYGYSVSDIMDLFKKNNINLSGQSYYRLFFVFVPRSVWQNKPLNTQQIVGEEIGGRNSYYSLPPGIQGDAFINFGYFGVLIFILYGAAAALLDKKTSPIYSLMSISAFMPIYHLARGGFTNPISLLVVTFLSIWLVNKWFLKIK